MMKRRAFGLTAPQFTQFAANHKHKALVVKHPASIAQDVGVARIST